MFCSCYCCHICWWSPYALVTVSVFRARHRVDRRAETDLYCQLPADVHSCHNWPTSAQSVRSHRQNAGTSSNISTTIRDRNLQNSEGMGLHLVPRNLRRSSCKQNSWSSPFYCIDFQPNRLYTVVLLLWRICYSSTESVCVLNLLDVRSEVLLSLVFVSLGIQIAFCTYCLLFWVGLAFHVPAKWKTLSLRLLTCEYCN